MTGVPSLQAKTNDTEHFPKTDVLVVGGGWCGVFSALLLSKQGVKVTLVAPRLFPQHSLGVLWPSLNDPPTRAYAAHGLEVACYLQDFCKQGLDFFLANGTGFAKNFVSVPAVRLGILPHECEELHKGAELGFGLKATSQPLLYEEISSALVGKNPQEWENQARYLLKENGITYYQDSVCAVKETRHHVSVQCEAGHMLSAEQAVLACGPALPQLLPHFSSILIPMKDVMISYGSQGKSACAFRAQNGHIAGYRWSGHLAITGPRFLLPQAGVGLNPQVSHAAACHAYHKKTLFPVLKQLDLLKEEPLLIQEGVFSVDCHPCDELPVLGEYGKWGRILGNSGWLGVGFSAGIQAARILCEMICQGNTPLLHPRLTPRRFFHKIKN